VLGDQAAGTKKVGAVFCNQEKKSLGDILWEFQRGGRAGNLIGRMLRLLHGGGTTIPGIAVAVGTHPDQEGGGNTSQWLGPPR